MSSARRTDSGSTTTTAVAHQQDPGLGRPTIHRASLNRSWVCDACGKPIPRGATVMVTITPGGGTNRVEHDPTCAGPSRSHKQRDEFIGGVHGEERR